jgi:DNA-binding response OmpR family regulator
MVRDVLAEKARADRALARLAAAPGLPGPGGQSAGRLWLDIRGRAVITDGRPVPLTATEFAILAAMMDGQGRVLSRRSLLAAAGHEAAGDRAADVYIAQLRAKIGPAAVIRTVRGAGYAMEPIQGGQ